MTLISPQQERYRRCFMIFTSSMHLLRLLESVVTEAPSLFADSHDGEVNLVRVIEVLIHLLKRISSSAVCLSAAHHSTHAMHT